MLRRDAEIKSLNYIRPYTWIQYDENRNVMDPYKLLPSIFEGYTREEIDELFISNEKLKDGGEAMTAYARMQSPKMSNQEINQISDGLKRYCELDTLAMVMIFEYWLHEINEGNNRGI